MNKEISYFIERKLKTYGNVLYAYFMMDKSSLSNPVFISNYPQKCIDTYIDNKLFINDPVIHLSLKRVTPFSWDDNDLAVLRSENEDVAMYLREHGITVGYTFVLHDHDNNLAILTIANNDEKNDFEDFIKNRENDLQMLLVTTHEKAMRYKHFVKGKTVPLDCLQSALITPRETEVLFLVSRGNTYKEVSRTLGISEATVKFHINNSVRKLNVINSRHAISKALELNLFRAFTESLMTKKLVAI
ncbi:LuxR family transcriptional regulator [Pectobacteriaceae bacterium CE90]|nr:LuxR family transcriptional regulator [Pectobacteriaceae bacterium CE90]